MKGAEGNAVLPVQANKIREGWWQPLNRRWMEASERVAAWSVVDWQKTAVQCVSEARKQLGEKSKMKGKTRWCALMLILSCPRVTRQPMHTHNEHIRDGWVVKNNSRRWRELQNLLHAYYSLEFVKRQRRITRNVVFIIRPSVSIVSSCSLLSAP